MQPLVSIVTPCFNQGPFIEETILSVLNQTYPNIEYIIIDGGSTDNTMEIIEKYKSKIKIIVHEKDCGQTHAINKGFKLASGDLLAWLCSDDYYTPDAIEKMVLPFMSEPDIGLVFGECFYISDHNPRVLGIKAPGENFGIKSLLKYGKSLAQPSTLFKRSLIEEVGYLDQSLKFAMDYDLWIKLFRRSKAVYINQPVSYYRLHSGSKTVSSTILSSKEVLKVAHKHRVNFFSTLSYYRRKAICKEYLKKIIKKKSTPIVEWSIWASGVKKFS